MKSHKSVCTIVAVCLIHLLFAEPACGQTEKASEQPDDRQFKAAEILKHDIGIWDCEWKYLDGEGNVTQIVTGTETMKFALGNKLVEIETCVPAGTVVSKSMRFYNEVTGKLVVLSVGTDGNHWEMHQDVESKVMISKPHANKAGKTSRIRFTVLEKSDDAMEVLMEQSNHQDVWKKIFLQTMKRRKK